MNIIERIVAWFVDDEDEQPTERRCAECKRKLPDYDHSYTGGLCGSCYFSKTIQRLR